MAIARSQRDGVTVVYQTSAGLTTKLSIEELRSIYDNREKNFLLGSFIAAPVVDLLNSFVGTPTFSSKDERANEILEGVMEANSLAVVEAQRMAFRDGMAYVRVAWEAPSAGDPLYGKDETGRIVLIPIPCDRIRVNKDPRTGDINYAEISDSVSLITPEGTKTTTLITRITKETEQLIVKSGDPVEGLDYTERENASGIVPIVEFANDPDPTTGKGVSEVARIAPLIAIYHDVLHNAVIGSKHHSVPKLQFAIDDLQAFIKANTGNDSTGVRKLDLTGRDSIFTGIEDKIKFIEAGNPIGATDTLLKKIFYCMIITSETPEYALGVHMNSSYASTSEQTPVWQMKVARKQLLFAGYWNKVGRVILAKQAFHSNEAIPSFATQVDWSAPDMRSLESKASARETTVTALTNALEGKLISWDAAIETMREVFPAIKQFNATDEKSEREKIIESAKELQMLSMGQAANVPETINIDQTIEAVNKLLKQGE